MNTPSWAFSNSCGIYFRQSGGREILQDVNRAEAAAFRIVEGRIGGEKIAAESRVDFLGLAGRLPRNKGRVQPRSRAAKNNRASNFLRGDTGSHARRGQSAIGAEDRPSWHERRSDRRSNRTCRAIGGERPPRSQKLDFCTVKPEQIRDVHEEVLLVDFKGARAPKSRSRAGPEACPFPGSRTNKQAARFSVAKHSGKGSDVALSQSSGTSLRRIFCTQGSFAEMRVRALKYRSLTPTEACRSSAPGL